MAEAAQNFRFAFHGFNREDVVSFLEQTMARHAQEVNELKEEIHRLEEELSQAREAPRADVAALRQENWSLKERGDALEEENKTLKETVESLEAQLTAPGPRPEDTDWESEELAAYRRAENVERQAKARASQLYDRVNGLVAELAARMDGSHQNMTEAAESLGKSLDGLQAALDLAQATLHDGAGGLRALHLEPEA